MEGTYQNVFLEAIDRTLKFKMELPNEDLGFLGKAQKAFSNTDNVKGVFTHVHRSLGGFTAEDLKGACIKYGILAKPYFENYLDTKAVLTVGYVIDNGTELYKFGDTEINNLIRRMPEKYTKAVVHVWLTLPSFEIIDLTYLESKRNLAGLPFNEEIGFSYVFESVENLYLKQRLVYCPMLVGVDSLFKLGLASLVNNEA